MQRIILDSNKKKLGFDELNYLVSPEEFVTDYNGLNIPLYNYDKSKYWISLKELSDKFISISYFNKKELNEFFVKKPLTYINEEEYFNYDIVLINSEKESFKISISDFEKLRDYKNKDRTLKIDDGVIFVNYNDVREDIIIEKPFKFPLQITLFNLFNEFSQVIVNERVLNKKSYFILDQNNIQLNKKVKDIIGEDNSELRVIVLGKKFLNNNNY